MYQQGNSFLEKKQGQNGKLCRTIHPVFLGTFGEIYHRATAGVWIDNCRKWGHLFKRPGQYYIQTWHGFPLKRIEGDAVEALDPEYVETAKRILKWRISFFPTAGF